MTVLTAFRERLWRRRPAPGAGRYLSWLIDRGSLTDRVRRRCAGFGVRLLFQGPRRPTRDERPLFGAGKSRALVREVCLDCGGEPMVFAHSVIRLRDLRGPWRVVARLGARPLGAALFADPRIKRRPLRFRRLVLNDELHARACAALRVRPQALWARSSLFTLHNSPILVTEVFLPGILKLAP
jgi:chorismate--pyruvate lyase